MGLIAAGIRVSPANSAYTPTELAGQYLDCSARLVFVHRDLLPVVLDMFAHIGVVRADARSRIVVMCLPGDDHPAVGLASMGELFGRGALPTEEHFDGELSDETLYLCYSSGTVGKPKGVEVRQLRHGCPIVFTDHTWQTTHYNVHSVLCTVEPMLPVWTPGTGAVAAVLPLFHIFGACLGRTHRAYRGADHAHTGLTQVMHYSLLVGLPIVIMPRYDPVQFCRDVEKYRISCAFVVPPILLALVHHPGT